MPRMPCSTCLAPPTTPCFLVYCNHSPQFSLYCIFFDLTSYSPFMWPAPVHIRHSHHVFGSGPLFSNYNTLLLYSFTYHIHFHRVIAYRKWALHAFHTYAALFNTLSLSCNIHFTDENTWGSTQDKVTCWAASQVQVGLKAKCPDSKFYDLFYKPYDSKSNISFLINVIFEPMPLEFLSMKRL